MNGKDFGPLFAKTQGVIKPGLERMLAALAVLDSPSLATPCVHIAGTNGKGSTAGFLFKLFSQVYRVGLFSSPHLISYAERFRIAHEDVNETDVYNQWALLKRDLEAAGLYASLSFFELSALIAMRLFAARSTDLNIWEVGMGGRWDATNVCRPTLTAIVTIGYDHQEFLGHTLAAIAAEKAGIVKPGSPVFLGDGGSLNSDPAALRVIEERAEACQVPIYRYGSDFFLEKGRCIMRHPALGEGDSTLPDAVHSMPAFLQRNYVLARAMHQWWQEHVESLSPRQGYDAQGLPPNLRGRYQKLRRREGSEEHAVLLDVAHNLPATQELIEALRSDADFTMHRVHGVCPLLRDKDVGEMLDLLKGNLASVVLFKTRNTRAIRQEDLPERHRDVPLFDSFASFWESRKQRAQQWLICGSLVGVGEALDYFDTHPSRSDLPSNRTSRGAHIPPTSTDDTLGAGCPPQ